MRNNYGKKDLMVKGVEFRDGTLAYEVISNGQVGYMTVESYQENSSSALARLTRQRIIIVGPRRAALSAYISDIDDFRPVPMCWKVGWSDNCFALPDGDVVCPDGVTPPGVVFDRHPDKVHQAGSQESWLAEVASPLSGHAISEFFMMAMFAGPLRSCTTRVENFGWEVVGERATGKSTLLSLVASACGGSNGGDDGNFGLTFATTAVAIEGEMRNYADLCMILDEANLFGVGLSPRARGNAMSALFMTLGRGQDKARHLSKVGTYRNIFITSANEPLARVIAGTSDPAVLAAVADRLMTITLDGRAHGVLDRVPEGFVDGGDFLDSLVDASIQNHGTAMRHYLKFIANERARDPQEFSDRVRQRIAEFCSEARMERNNGSARRVAEAFGLIYTAGRIARHCGALPLTYDPLQSTLECYRIHAEGTSTEPHTLRLIRNIAASPQVIDLDEIGLPTLSDKRLASKIGFLKRNKYGEQELLIPPTSMRKQIGNWNHARREFAVSRVLTRDSDGRHTTKKNVRANERGDRMVCINLTKLGSA